MKPISSLSSNSLSSASIGGTHLDSSGLSVAEHAALAKAVTRNNLAEFQAISSKHPQACANAVFDNGQNILHLATASQSYAVARDFLQRCPEWTSDLVNARDDHGHTPLTYVCAGPQDNADLVVQLLRAGTREDLIAPLLAAARNGHENIAVQLIEAGADLNLALPKLCDANIPAEESWRGTCILQSFEPDSIHDVLSAVAHTGDSHVAAALQIHGASGSRVLLNMASHGTLEGNALTTLLKSGLDLPQAIIGLVQRGDLSKASQVLGLAKRFVTNDTVAGAVIQLAEKGDMKTLSRMAPLFNTEIRSNRSLWEELITRCDASTLKGIMSLGLTVPNGTLKTLVDLEHVGAMKKLLDAGVPPSMMIKAAGSNLSGDEKRVLALKAAGVDVGGGNNVSSTRDQQRQRQVFGKLSSEDQLQAIADIVAQGKTGLVAWLLTAAKDPQSLLKQAARRADGEKICSSLLRSGLVDAESLLVDLVKSDQMNDAKKLLRAMRNARLSDFENVCTPVLFNLIQNGDLGTAKKFMPSLTSGESALAQAASINDMGMVTSLVEAGADVSLAVGTLIQKKQVEAAGRILEQEAKVDFDLALMWAIDGFSHTDGYKVLELVGAKLSNALFLAAKEGHDHIVEAIVEIDESLVREVLIRVSSDPALAEWEKRDIVQEWRFGSLTLAGALEELARDSTTLSVLRHILSLGAPSENALVALAKRGELSAVEQLIFAGSATRGAMRTLVNGGNTEAVEVLKQAMESAKRRFDGARPLAI
ncbi:ankyrin repeat domain-containing protein [Bordetella sp. 02P26C-1]|uniref:ankyrin repeat domain-containing protein n=1 Tax=Bordetella sp. 02P26C-1 TaxID=2683195 RepID=UPI001353D62B|nr:ankyrin repeat domain-containing protein [Bordetella sp. 02P26C-1]MVW79539.1 hypothetical protein [Bordetella sp. 02P26C-1]